ncbi:MULTISPECIES: alanine racemase [unclassified Novosphingobium]|uniref:alanine racemase n=1 Tax=unclassified Novosphingobium TaxID=2644732 RepID=UPI0025F8FE61|nr:MULTISPECIES: alanine racemase [unclassified Novosphingobium]HQV02736.1 alanine racemase [Novosphingobium sp.]
MTPPEPPLRLILDTDALVHNWRVLDRLSGTARAGAAVKADGYGLGAVRVVRALAAAGCRDFFVAYPSEAAALEGLVDSDRIAILHGPQSLAEAQWIAARGFRPVINSVRQASMWADAGAGPCDLMVDTGINRLGVAMADLAAPAITTLNIRTVHSHLASADEDSPLNAQQLSRWRWACAQIGQGEVSLANSAGIMLGSDFHGDLTRPGLALYGGVPSIALASEIRQVAFPEAAIMQVRTVNAGEGIGYNATFVAERDMRVGVVAMGYADGYLRCWSGKGVMRADDAHLPVLGRVSMDMTVIDLSAAPHLGEGDWVGLDYTLPEAARISGLSQYELLTLLGGRFAR